MAKSQHPLEEITVAIDLVVLLNAIKVETTNGFFYSHAEGTLSERRPKAELFGEAIK